MSCRTAGHPSEFRCCECGRDVVRWPALREGEIGLCVPCMGLPGWFRYPDIRAVIDPDHDGLELCERQEVKP